MQSSKPFLFLSFILAIVIHIILLAALFFVFRQTPPSKPIHPVYEKRMALAISPTHLSQPAITTLVLPLKPHELPIPNKPTKPFLFSEKKSDTNTSVTLPPPYNDSKPLTRNDINLLPKSILHHYGDEFFELSAPEQHYLLNNLQKIRKINDIVGNRLLQSKSNGEIDTKENNTVEFYLHPDGSMSDLLLFKEREGSLLDALTLETIELAHTQYPRPKQTTLIRIRVWILVK
jgi:outer membrane biosynthesis protein TonB